MTVENCGTEIDLRRVWRIIVRGKWIIICLPLLMALIAAAVCRYGVLPVYRASTILMVANTNASTAPLLHYDDILIAEKLVNTYGEIAKSRTVAEKVIEAEGLPITLERFREMVNIKAVRNTQLIEISAENTDPETARRIATLTALVFVERVVQVMRVDHVTVVDPAITPREPVKPYTVAIVSLAALGGLMIGLGTVFLRDYLDNTIKTADDAAQYLGTSVLGTIPRYKPSILTPTVGG